MIVISDDEDEVIASEILEKKTNKMHKQTNDQTNKCIDKQINADKQTNNQTNKDQERSRQTKMTNKQINAYKHTNKCIKFADANMTNKCIKFYQTCQTKKGADKHTNKQMHPLHPAC